MSAVTSNTATPVPPEKGFSAIDLALLLASNAKLLIGGSLAVGIAALLLAFLITPIYTATARILPPSQQQSASAALAAQLGALAGVVGSSAVKSPTDQYIALLKSRTVADALAI